MQVFQLDEEHHQELYRDRDRERDGYQAGPPLCSPSHRVDRYASHRHPIGCSKSSQVLMYLSFMLINYVVSFIVLKGLSSFIDG